ncbi:MAG TPA: flippase [Cyclobacteriaceae bacterium]|nr:flippase [Cyclobacteriaceae bacterium]
MKIPDLFPKKFLESRIGKNFIALSFWQVTNYLAPLIIMPYLIRVIGTEKFGVVSLIQAVTNYFIIIVDYGFSISAVKEISVGRNDPLRLQTLFNRTLFTKLFLCIISFLVLLAAVYTVPDFANYRQGYLAGFLAVIGQTMFPIWFYQGVERMKYTTYLNVGSKLLYMIAIFVFIRTPEQYPIVLLIQGSAVVVAGLAGIFLISRQYNIRLALPAWRVIFSEIRNGWPIFISNISVTFYNSTLYLIVGLLVNERLLGVYSIAERTSQVLRQVVNVFSQAVYSQLCVFATQGHDLVRSLWKKMLPPFAVLLFMICLAVSLMAPFVLMVIAGATDELAVTLLRIMIWVPFIVLFNVPFFQTLLAYGFNKEVMRALLSCSFVSVVMSYVLVSRFSVYGAAASLIITECLIVLSLMWLLETRKGHSIITR